MKYDSTSFRDLSTPCYVSGVNTRRDSIPEKSIPNGIRFPKSQCQTGFSAKICGVPADITFGGDRGVWLEHRVRDLVVEHRVAVLHARLHGRGLPPGRTQDRAARAEALVVSLSRLQGRERRGAEDHKGGVCRGMDRPQHQARSPRGTSGAAWQAAWRGAGVRGLRNR